VGFRLLNEEFRYAPEVTRDWIEWHSAYGDPDSSLSHRLAVVQRLIRNAVETAPPGTLRLLSLCAGDARDVVVALREHPRAQDVIGTLIELDPHLADSATANVAAAGLSLDVVCGDASETARFTSSIPVDVLLLVGIFGNISNEDVATTVAAVPSMCRAGATVIWTRHRREPDLTPSIRKWFDDANCTSIEFCSPGSGSFAVGSERVMAGDGPALPTTLFTFREDLS
jgi:hypothetical protein